DARLVAWLVRNHLALSITSQKQDIGDPQVINAFAHKVGDETHLDYLYVLTCADVRATNPKLWNSWKASLFSDFYQRVKRALRRAAGGARSAQRPRHDRGADLRTPAPARLRAHHRGARSSRTQHRGCAHHADRRRLQSRALSPARGRRRADHRHRPADRDRAG